MAPEARLYMRDCSACLGRSKCPAPRARRVALDDHEPGIVQQCADLPGYEPGMDMRVGQPGATEFDIRKLRHAIVSGPEVRMLAGDDQARANTAPEERFG